MTERRYSVYIMASRRNGTLYVGVTNHLGARAFQHRNAVGSQFTAKYGVKTLVWHEHYGDVDRRATCCEDRGYNRGLIKPSA